MTTLNRGTSSYRDCCLWNICPAFPSPSDCKGSQKMKPSVMAHFQGFTNRSVAGHGIMIQERAEHPQLFAGHWGWQWLQGSWDPMGGGRNACPGLWFLWGMGTGPQPPNPQVIWYGLTFLPASLATSFLAKLEKRGWKGPQGVCSPATSPCRAKSLHPAPDMLAQPDLNPFWGPSISQCCLFVGLPIPPTVV